MTAPRRRLFFATLSLSLTLTLPVLAIVQALAFMYTSRTDGATPEAVAIWAGQGAVLGALTIAAAITFLLITKPRISER